MLCILEIVRVVLALFSFQNTIKINLKVRYFWVLVRENKVGNDTKIILVDETSRISLLP